MKRTDPGPLIGGGASAEGERAPVRLPLFPFLPVAAVALGACTVVRVNEGSSVRTHYYPGVAVIRVTPTDSVQMVEVESLGVSSLGKATTLGWNHSRVALVPPGRCQLILWQADRKEMDELRSLIGQRTGICDGEGEGQ